MYLREIGWEVVDYIHLAKDIDQWLSLLEFCFFVGWLISICCFESLHSVRKYVIA